MVKIGMIFGIGLSLWLSHAGAAECSEAYLAKIEKKMAALPPVPEGTGVFDPRFQKGLHLLGLWSQCDLQLHPYTMEGACSADATAQGCQRVDHLLFGPRCECPAS